MVNVRFSTRTHTYYMGDYRPKDIDELILLMEFPVEIEGVRYRANPDPVWCTQTDCTVSLEFSLTEEEG